MSWLGLATGVVDLVRGILDGPAFAAGGSFYSGIQDLPVAALGLFVWMLATEIYLFRRAPRPVAASI